MVFLNGMIWCVGPVYYCVWGLQNSMPIQPRSDIPCPPFTQGTSLQQQFIVSRGTLSAVAVKFGTYQRVNSGLIEGNIVLQSAVAEETREFIIELDQLKDNEWYPIRFNPVQIPAVSECTLQMTVMRMKPGNEVTLWASNQDAILQENLTINGEQFSGDIALQSISVVKGMDVFNTLYHNLNITFPFTLAAIIIILGSIVASIVSVSTGLHSCIRKLNTR
jgi:hypothetical protein